MARKQKPENEATPETTETPTPKTRTRRKAAEETAPVESVKSTRASRKKVEEAPAAEPVAKEPAKTRKPRAKVEAAEPAPAETAAPPAPVKKGLFGKAPVRAAKAAEPVAPEPAPEPAPAKPELTKAESAKPEPAKPAKQHKPKAEAATPSLVASFRPRAEAKPQSPPQPRPVLDSNDSEGRFSVLNWREKSGRRPEPDETPAEPKRKDRPRKEKADEPIWVEVKASEPVAVPEPPKAEIPQFEPISIPETAAQVVTKDGQPILVRQHRVYAPLCFYGHASSPQAMSTVLEQVKMAAEEGIHLFSTDVELVVDPTKVKEAVSRAVQLVGQFVQVDPAAQVILRTRFEAPKNWESLYPSAKYVKEDGGIAEPSVCDDAYWEVAKQCLTKFTEQLRASEEFGNIMGIHLDRDEWFFAEGSGYDTSIAAHEKFRTWLRQRYRNDVVTLRASWFEGSSQFETVSVPEYGQMPDHGERFVRMGRKSRRWVDYHLFLSDTTVERLFELLYTVKKHSDGEFLTGVSYGYTFEWSHPASGHLSLGKLLRCKYLDYVAGPPSYRTREPGGTAAFPGPVDSVALNGKLFLSEEDFKTPIGGPSRDLDDHNPTMKTPQALESAHWRGAGAAFAHKGGLTWMDSQGHGWLGSRGIWERAQKIHNAFFRRLEVKQSPPDVAMFIDERSLALLVEERAFTTLVQNVREALLRSGLSVGFYLLSDLAHRENFPESKLYVFANAWDLRPEVRSAIKSRLQRGNKTLFWLYAAGLFEGGRDSLERVREVTGVALRPQPFNSKPGTTLLNNREPLCSPLPEKLLAEGGRLEPSYFAIPEEGTVLAEYTQTGLPSYVARHFDGEDGGWTSVFLGEPVVTPGLFRALGELSGCHVWSHNDDVVHVSGPFLTVHCTGTGQRVVNLPDKWVAYRLETDEYEPVEKNSFRFMALDGTSWSFMVGPSAVVQAMVKADLAKLSHIDTAGVREENTVHWEDVQFDVQIMKLDEWVEESWGEEMEGDLLIKPSLLEIDVESGPEETDSEEPRSRGRRRNRRGGRDRRRGNDRADREKVGETGMSVLFRKRV